MNEDEKFRLKLVKALPLLTPQFSPSHGCLHEQDKVSFSLSNKQEPPFRHPVTRHPCNKKDKSITTAKFLFYQGNPATKLKQNT